MNPLLALKVPSLHPLVTTHAPPVQHGLLPPGPYTPLHHTDSQPCIPKPHLKDDAVQGI